MEKGKKLRKNGPTRKQIYILLGFVCIVLLALYFSSWYKVKKQERLMDSYLLTTNTLSYTIESLDEVPQILNESPMKYFIYISHNDSEDIYKLERKLKDTIDDYGLNDAIYYVNVNNIKDDKDLLTKLNDTFNTTKIKEVPCILYFENGKFEEIVQHKGGTFTNNDFKNLLNNYDYEIISQ